jgi:hypothetical protein
MFEYKIQNAWDSYISDFGLGRVILFICFFNLLLMFLGILMTGYLLVLSLYPIGLSLLFYFLRPQIIKLRSLYIFLINTIPITITIVFNYYLVGEFDRLAQGLIRYDEWFSSIDQSLFGKQIAILIQDFWKENSFKTVYYDLIQTAYLTYYIFPIYGGVLYYRLLDEKRKYKIGRYFSSMAIFYSVNYLFYLIIPVMGPQFYHRDLFQNTLPLSSYGELLHSIVSTGQVTFIDCFPSGHTGIAILVTIWLFRIHHQQRFISLLVSILMILATLSLRYHYTLDVLSAFPLALICYKLGHILIPIDVYRRQKVKK